MLVVAVWGAVKGSGPISPKSGDSVCLLVMLRSTALLLLLCACVARPIIDELDADDATAGDDPSDDETTASDTTPPLDTGPGTITVTSGDLLLHFEVDIQPIFDEHCVMACHEPDGEWGFLLDLSPSAFYETVSVPSPELPSMSIVEPYQPEASYLWHKINGTQADVGGSGLMMPKGRAGMQATVLTQEQLDAIEKWILDGALQ